MSSSKGAPPEDGRDESRNQRADRNWNDILQELRVTQTGIQLISGFLLAVAFQSRFSELDSYQITLYLTLVVLAASATLLGLAPVVIHRAYFGRQLKATVVRIGDRLLTVNVVIVSVLTAGVCGLIFDFVLNRVAGVIALVVGLILAAGLCFLTRPWGAQEPQS